MRPESTTYQILDKTRQTCQARMTKKRKVMPKHTISFAKIVAPPSSTAWAQTYHAGNVYTVVSVAGEIQANPEHALPSVHVIGKDIINNLEAEYFAIAEKNLTSIQEALENVTKEIPETISATIIFAILQENILYLFLYGEGQITIQRGDIFGVLLASDPAKTRAIISASGQIQPHDTIILASKQFSHAIPHKQLQEQKEHTPQEIADLLSPFVDDEKYAGAAAIIMQAEGEKESKGPEEPSHVTKGTQDKQEKFPLSPMTPLTSEEPMDLDDKLHLEPEYALPIEPIEKKQKKKLFSFSLRKIFFLIIAIGLTGILIGSIIISQKKQQQIHAQQLFTQNFPVAQQKYDEGQNMLSLNNQAAQDNFTQAKQILETLQTQNLNNMSEQQQISHLLAQVNDELDQINNGQITTLTSVDTNTSKLLAAEIANETNIYFSQDNNNLYTIDAMTISTINRANKTTSVMKNNNDWDTIGGFQSYYGNFYVLDTKANQILKFTKGSDGYGKTNYFNGSTPDLSKAVSLAIDGSVWILANDGSLQKFTKGQKDQFVIKNLQTAFNHPTRVFTTVDMDNIYILDNGNNRIVVVKKDTGDIVHEYASPTLKNAKDIDVDEKNNKIFILINGKVFAITMS